MLQDPSMALLNLQLLQMFAITIINGAFLMAFSKEFLFLGLLATLVVNTFLSLCLAISDKPSFDPKISSLR